MNLPKKLPLSFALLLCSSILFAQWAPTPANNANIYNTNAGSVGIGTLTPDMYLSVGGGIRVDANGSYAGSPYNNTPWLSFGIGSGEGVASNRMSSAPNQMGLDLYTSFAPRLSIANAGNVGIGTQNPDMKLSIMGNLRVDGGDAFNGGAAGTNTYPALSFGATGSGEGIGSNRPGGSINQDGLDFYTGFVIRMSVSRNGNLLIGKTSQTNTAYLLDVAGMARANKVVVNATGADFVFDPAYQLPSLPAVASYIKKKSSSTGHRTGCSNGKKWIGCGRKPDETFTESGGADLVPDRNEKGKRGPKTTRRKIGENAKIRENIVSERECKILIGFFY